MAFNSHVGSFNTGTGAAGTTVSVTGLGFQPKCLILWYSGRTESTDTIGRATLFRGLGIVISDTNRWCITSTSEDAVGSSSSRRAVGDDCCIIYKTPNNTTVTGKMDFQSFDSDGFTLVVDDSMPADFRVSYLALGGATISNLAVGNFQEQLTTGDFDVTGLGFQPDFVLFGSICYTTFTPGTTVVTTDGLFMVGAATSSTDQWVLVNASDHGNATSDTARYCTDLNCLAVIAIPPTGTPVRASFTSFLPDGFRVNFLERNAQRYFFYLALKGGNYKAGNLLTQTDTTTDITVTCGFKPIAALFGSHNTIESTSDTPQTEDSWSFGGFSSLTNRSSQASLDEDNLPDTEVTTAIETDQCYINIASDSTIQGLMDVKSIDQNGFTMIMDDADPAQSFVGYIAFGPEEVPVPLLKRKHNVLLRM